MTDKEKVPAGLLKKTPDPAKFAAFVSGNKDAQADNFENPEIPAQTPALQGGKLALSDLLPKTEKPKTLPIKLLPVLHKAAVACAEKRSMTIHDYVLLALEEKVQRDTK